MERKGNEKRGEVKVEWEKRGKRGRNGGEKIRVNQLGAVLC